MNELSTYLIGSISYANENYRNPFLLSKSSPDLLIFPSSPPSSCSFLLKKEQEKKKEKPNKCHQCQTNHWPKCSCCGQEMIGQKNDIICCYFYNFCSPCQSEYKELFL